MKQKKKDLKVIITNPPSKKEAKEIIKRLSKKISESLSDNTN